MGPPSDSSAEPSRDAAPPISRGGRGIRLVRHYLGERPHWPEQGTLTARDPGPKTAAGHLYRQIKRVLIGQPIPSTHASHERLTRVKALAVLSSDAISSVAYGPEAALLVLSAAGAGALVLNLPISAAIAVLLIIVTFSYRQTIFAYPSGGGSYIVASENLGRIPGLIAASALLIDYVLTVAVSVASGVAALASAVPALADSLVPLGLAFIALLAIGNLRGVRESGALFAAPTYLFIVSLFALVAVGLVRAFVLHDPAATGVPRTPVPGGEAVGTLLDDLDQCQPGATITVVLPELVPAHWWEQPLHTQTALRLKAALLFRPGTVVTSVPYHLEREHGADERT